MPAWVLLFLGGALLSACAQEFRGLWVDAFHPGFRNATEIAQLVADARRGNFNALIVEVRKRGDAYYASRFEPKATDIAASFDPLAELLRQAHSTSAGARLEVHAWIVTYNIWNQQNALPPQPNHPYRLHPDWLTKSYDNATWDGSNYAFDPGHPAVQEHTFNVAMDLIARYDLDGFHFDYIRYAGREWGYNDVAVARFNRQTGSTGKPAMDDSAWLQWRRDQVTGLVRRVYLSAIALKPDLVVSAATITWTPSPTSYTTWLGSAAYSDVLQDWRGWMEEGLLDLNVPMAYFRQEQNAADWNNWSKFAKEHRYGRHLALGPGVYLNTLSNAIVQMRSTRTPVAAAPRAEGVVCYSYAVTSKDSTRDEFLRALTQPTAHDRIAPPMFASPSLPPTMPWKSSGATVALLGTVRDAVTGQPIDGAEIEVCAPEARVLRTDANGFYGALRLSKHTYGLASSAPSYATQFQSADLRAGGVARIDFALSPADPDLLARDIRISPGTNSAWVSWRTQVPSLGQVIFGLDGPCGPSGGVTPDGVTGTNHAVFLNPLHRTSTDDPWEFVLRLVSWDGARTNYSELHRFNPAWPQVRDEAEARWVGSWAYVTNTSGTVEHAYRRATLTTGSNPTAVLTWSLPIQTSGSYDVSVLYPNGVAGSPFAPFEIESRSGKKLVVVNQSTAGGAYRRIVTNLFYAKGDTAIVRLRNNPAAAGGSYVLADAVMWSLSAGEDPPPPGQVPHWWAEHFFDPPVAGGDDPDADGSSNYAEYVLGTDPTRPSSGLAVRLEEADEAGCLVVFAPYCSGRRYRLLAAASADGPTWTVVPTVGVYFTPAGESALLDPDPPDRERYYQVQARVGPWP